MNEFTASNGIKILTYPMTSGITVKCLGSYGHNLTGDETDAIREFIEHERDGELGRWRWPENPTYVVYGNVIDPARRQVRGVTVVSETIPRTYTVWEDNVDVLYGASANEESRQEVRAAARAYFDAHPHDEPKPWLNAQLGDLWALTLEGEEVACVVMSSRDDFLTVGQWAKWGMIPRRSERIESGRRIWPEAHIKERNAA